MGSHILTVRCDVPAKAGLTTFAKASVVRRSFSGGASPALQAQLPTADA